MEDLKPGNLSLTEIVQKFADNKESSVFEIKLKKTKFITFKKSRTVLNGCEYTILMIKDAKKLHLLNLKDKKAHQLNI